MKRATAENIGAKIRARRKVVPWIDDQGELREGMSQEELAKKLGYSQVAVSHWERGRRVPTLEAQWAIAKVLRVDTFDLFGPTEVAA